MVRLLRWQAEVLYLPGPCFVQQATYLPAFEGVFEMLQGALERRLKFTDIVQRPVRRTSRSAVSPGSNCRGDRRVGYGSGDEPVCC